MPTLVITKTYADTEVLTEADLDNFKSGVETFLNTTKIDADNIQAGGVEGSNLNANVVDDSTLEISANALQVKDGGITAGKLGNSILYRPGSVNIGLEAAQTSVTADSIKITSATGTALSATNAGEILIQGATPGTLDRLTITSDVTMDLTGLPFGFGGGGDLTNQVLAVYALNDGGTLKWGVAYETKRKLWLTTEDETSAASTNDWDKILVSSALSNDAQALLVGYFKANFDDTGGSSEDLWTVQTGDGDIIVGEPAPLELNRLVVDTPNGHGSTDTVIRRFSNVQQSYGKAVTRASTAANGDTFTINRPGWYAISYSDSASVSEQAGISLNATQLTTGILSTSITDPSTRLAGALGTRMSTSVTRYLKTGEVIRPHTNGGPNSANTTNFFAVELIIAGESGAI